MNTKSNVTPEEAYTELANRMNRFKTEDAMLIDVNIDALEDGNELWKSLYIHEAKHHKCCKLPCRQTKLERILSIRSSTSSTPRNSETAPKKINLRKEFTQQLCFFCDLPSDGEKNKLHLVQSFRLDQRVRRCVRIIENTILHAKLQNGDMIAHHAMYHRKCILDLYRQSNTKQLEGKYSDKERQIIGIAFSEIVSYIEETSVAAQNVIPLFKLSELKKMYTQRLGELIIQIGDVQSTRFKNRILAQFQDLREYREGREVLLAFETDIGEALKSASSIDYDDERFILAEAAKILRSDILNDHHEEFNSSFYIKCQENCVTPSVQALIGMEMRGKDINHIKSRTLNKPC